MVNRYKKGANKERLIQQYFQAKYPGSLTMRSAGSHSPIDVCIFLPPDQTVPFSDARILAIQSKYNTTNIPAEIQKLKELQLPENTEALLFVHENRKPTIVYNLDSESIAHIDLKNPCI